MLTTVLIWMVDTLEILYVLNTVIFFKYVNQFYCTFILIFILFILFGVLFLISMYVLWDMCVFLVGISSRCANVLYVLSNPTLNKSS